MVMRRVTPSENEVDEFIVPMTLAPKGDREAILSAVRYLSPDAEGKASEFLGGQDHADILLKKLKPAEYGRTRNYLKGAVTRLSPFIRHGVLSLNEVRNETLKVSSKREAEKFIQQLAWRDYWQRLYSDSPQIIWTDIEDYKTGFSAEDYADVLPEDIKTAQTGVACIDTFLNELIDSGTLHNHARLYLAGYICHWRRVKWQAGARFFLTHLLDGDPASNNLSWQWVASTFSHKPYYYNLDNIRKFSGDDLDTSDENNSPLEGSYEAIFEKLFPNLEKPS